MSGTAIVFSVQGPPFFEVIHGPPGSPWDATAGSRFDHLGYWSGDLDADKQRLAERGAAVEFDGWSFAYHRLDHVGLRVELVDTAVQPGFVETYCPGSPPMPPIDFDKRIGS